MKENERLKKMEVFINKEKHHQQVELAKAPEQNYRRAHCRNERDRTKVPKQIVLEWKKTENKDEVLKQIQNLLFRKKTRHKLNKLAKKIDSKYQEVKAEITAGVKVKMKKNHQVGEVKRNKKQTRHNYK